MTRVTLKAAIAVAVTALALTAPPDTIVRASAIDAQACPAGQQPVGDLGILALQCDCTVNRTARAWRFRSEPVVRQVDAGGPAAGRLQAGDVIVSIDGVSVLTAEGGDRFGRVTAGQTATLGVRRNGRTMEIGIGARGLCSGDPRSLFSHAPSAAPAPGERPAPPGAAPAAPATPRASSPRTGSAVPLPNFPLPRFGFALACAGCGWALEAGAPHPIWESRDAPRVHQVEPDGPAARGGIRAGDRLTHVEGLVISTPAGGARFGAARPGESVTFTVDRDGRGLQVVVVPDPPADREAPNAPQLPRYEGVIGNVTADVRSSAPIRATVSPAGDEMLIETGTATVRLRIRQRD